MDELNFNKLPDTSVTGSQSCNIYSVQNCSSRLSCGVCVITGNMCPVIPYHIEPVWCQSQPSSISGEAHTNTGVFMRS